MMPQPSSDFSRTSHPRSFTLCADDYGLTPGIGQGIRALITAGALSATGCMTVSPFWPEEARLLQPLEGRADLGLHLTLTDHHPLGSLPDLAPEGRFPPVGKLLLRALRRQLKAPEIKAEILRQIDSFRDHFGRLPDFVDGHHHVHQFPIIRDALIEAIGERLTPGRFWVRSCYESPFATLRRGIDAPRALIITQLGWGLDRRLKRLGWAHNRGFRGIYDFSDRVAYGDLLPKFLERPRPDMLVMCHPGLVDEALLAVESLTYRREHELAFLASPAFPALLDQRGLSLSRPSLALHSPS